MPPALRYHTLRTITNHLACKCKAAMRQPAKQHSTAGCSQTAANSTERARPNGIVRPMVHRQRQTTSATNNTRALAGRTAARQAWHVWEPCPGSRDLLRCCLNTRAGRWQCAPPHPRPRTAQALDRRCNCVCPSLRCHSACAQTVHATNTRTHAQAVTHVCMQHSQAGTGQGP
jgi:hypothetical protein